MDQQDTFNNAISIFIERKVRSWLSGVIEEMRRNSPVQQWLDSLPTDSEPAESTKPSNEVNMVMTQTSHDDNPHIEPIPVASKKEDDSISSLPLVQDNKSLDSSDWKRKSFDNKASTSTPQKPSSKKLTRDNSIQSEGCVQKLKNPLLRDYSLQSDGSGSSGHLLGAREVDAEAVLLELGFGPSEKQQKLQRIPDRFLVPSKLKGISTEKFIKDEMHSMRMHDCGVFGFRGLTGNPHVPPSPIVAKIMERILRDDQYRRELTNARLSVSPPSHCPTRFLRNT